jgi:hypothetical protein
MSQHKCCVEDCEKPATRHSQSANPSHYCDLHGVCSRCGDSVELFEPYRLENGNTIYVCLCVKKALSAPLPPRPPIIYLVKEEKQATIRDHWSA